VLRICTELVNNVKHSLERQKYLILDVLPLLVELRVDMVVLSVWKYISITVHFTESRAIFFFYSMNVVCELICE